MFKKLSLFYWNWQRNKYRSILNRFFMENQSSGPLKEKDLRLNLWYEKIFYKYKQAELNLQILDEYYETQSRKR